MQKRSKILCKQPLSHSKFYYRHAWLVSQLLKTSSSESRLLPTTHNIVHAVCLYLLPLPRGITPPQKNNPNNNSNINERSEMILSTHFTSLCIKRMTPTLLSRCFTIVCVTPWFSISVMHGVDPHKNAFHWKLAESRIHTSSLLCWETSKGWATNRLQHLLAVGLKLSTYKVMTTCSLKCKLLILPLLFQSLRDCAQDIWIQYKPRNIQCNTKMQTLPLRKLLSY